jgi:hypothetical protein
MALAWFRPEQWDRLRAVAADSDRLETSYDTWREVAQETIDQLQQEGVVVEKIDVDLDELELWCRDNGLTLDASARANFAAAKLQQRYGDDERGEL